MPSVSLIIKTFNMKKYTNSTAISIALTALLVGSLFWLMATKRVNSSLEAGLQEQKLKSETLLSEKLLLEKDMQKMKDHLSRVTGESDEMRELMKSTSAKLETQELEYNRIKRENISLHQIRKQRQQLTELNSELQNQLQALTNENAQLDARNGDLERRIAFLQEQNKTLTDDLNRAVFAAIDQSQVHAVKGRKGKLTIKARQTKQIIANFEVAASLKNLSFRIIDAKGNLLPQALGTFAATTTPSQNNFIASTEDRTFGNSLQRVDMVFTPKRKLDSGVYTVEILNDNLYVGSLRVKLK